MKKGRINAIKEYMEKNGKKIKRSAAAIALAGLTTLSATTMSGCEEISNIIPGHETHFVEPTIDPSTLNEDELTGEQVLALYDSIVWYDQVTKLKERGYFDDSYNVSVQFEKMACPTNLGFGCTNEVELNDGTICIASNNDIRVRQPVETDLYNCYTTYFDFTYNVNGKLHPAVRQELCDSIYLVAKDQFEPCAELMGNGKRIITEEEWEYVQINDRNTLGTIYSTCMAHIGQTLYYPFEITRDDILNANQEQLKALYEMYKSIYDINVKFDYPPEILSPDIQSDNDSSPID